MSQSTRSPSQATGETPFFLVYGAEAVLSLEVTNRSPWVSAFDEDEQDQLRQLLTQNPADGVESRIPRAARADLEGLLSFGAGPLAPRVFGWFAGVPAGLTLQPVKERETVSKTIANRPDEPMMYRQDPADPIVTNRPMAI